MRRIARTGEPLMPVDGLGWVWQRWVIVDVHKARSVLVADGTPRRIGFRLTLRSCGADRA
jgi:phage protein U